MKAKRTRKGFTLMELIIVIAIMGILMAILIPSWGYFMRRAHERDANSRAKIIFNAAQTQVTHMCDVERSVLNKYNDSTIDSELKEKLKKQIYVGNGDFYFYWNGKEGFKLETNGINVANKTENAMNNSAFSRGINNIAGSEGLYKIYVKNYNVQSVVYTAYADGNYKGTYPKGMNELSSKDLNDFRDTTMYNIGKDLMGKIVTSK